MENYPMRTQYLIAAAFFTALFVSLPGMSRAQQTLPYEPKQAEPGSEESVDIKTLESDSTVQVYLMNHNTYPVIVTFDALLRNMISKPKVPLTTTISPKSSRYVTTLREKTPFQGWSYRTRIAWSLGAQSPDPDTLYAYRLPYREYQAYRVGQGFMGSFSHKGHASYAVDFVMSEGTPVIAARSGIVVDAREDSDVQGEDISYNDDSNYIVIWHSDGTFAQYAHLKKNGVHVNIGDSVTRGQWIGDSGNTGYTTGPHLHFEVFVTASPNEQQSIPVCFDTAEGVICNPQERAAYTAVSRRKGSR
jgi:murein DD-endopeptidase MepM/ murein hydrolase activator NlpD